MLHTSIEMSPSTHASLPQGGTLLTLTLDLDAMVWRAEDGGLAELRGVAKVLGLGHKVAHLRSRAYAGYQVVTQPASYPSGHHIEVWRGECRVNEGNATSTAMKAEAILAIIERAIHGGDS